jgi:hypothetical protein
MSNEYVIMPQWLFITQVSINDYLVQLAMKTCSILKVPLNTECHIFRVGSCLDFRANFNCVLLPLTLKYLISTPSTGEQ